MFYQNIILAKFISRVNRFVAICELDGKTHPVHVKNTGRLKELLLPGAQVYVQKCDLAHRKTKYTLISIEKSGELFNIDSTAPNQVVFEALTDGLRLPGQEGKILALRREFFYDNSRLDICAEDKRGKWLIEVKGVTLRVNNLALFPDAPTERGIKHLETLIRAQNEGYRCAVVFVVQMDKAEGFAPNINAHREFAYALLRAKNRGVRVLACLCRLSPEQIALAERIPVYMEERNI